MLLSWWQWQPKLIMWCRSKMDHFQTTESWHNVLQLPVSLPSHLSSVDRQHYDYQSTHTAVPRPSTSRMWYPRVSDAPRCFSPPLVGGIGRQLNLATDRSVRRQVSILYSWCVFDLHNTNKFCSYCHQLSRVRILWHNFSPPFIEGLYKRNEFWDYIAEREEQVDEAELGDTILLREEFQSPERFESKQGPRGRWHLLWSSDIVMRPSHE